MALQELIQEKLNLEHKWAKSAQQLKTDDMKWTDLKLRTLKTQVENLVEQEQKTSIAS